VAVQGQGGLGGMRVKALAKLAGKFDVHPNQTSRLKLEVWAGHLYSIKIGK